MQNIQEKVAKLKMLRKKNKFADSAWEKRGLIPSDSKMSTDMNHKIDLCLDELLLKLQSDETDTQLYKIFSKGLESFNSSDYDTEEREFVVDEFHEIGEILGLDVAEILNHWMHGKELASMLMAQKKEDVISLKSFACAKCKTKLDVKTLAVMEGVPKSWFIGRCSKCSEYNLLSIGANVGKVGFENIIFVEAFYGDNNNEVHAQKRLEQLKNSKG